MKESIIRNGKITLLVLFCMVLVGCVANAEDRKKSDVLEEAEQFVDRSEPLEESWTSVDFDKLKESTVEIDNSIKEEGYTLIPMEYQWQEGDRYYDPEDTIYYKTYYDDFVRGKIRHIEYPDINIRDELEEYFIILFPGAL